MFSYYFCLFYYYSYLLCRPQGKYVPKAPPQQQQLQQQSQQSQQQQPGYSDGPMIRGAGMGIGGRGVGLK